MAMVKYDVFLSFRSEIRRSFTCHVSRELKRRSFKPFMDCESIVLGDKIQDTIETAITHSKSAIVILSDDYASSDNCLDELVLILKRSRMSKYLIIPVFYYVDTDDVKHQLGKFGAAFDQIKQQHQDDKVEEWITALASIGRILGKEIKEESGLLESLIIEDILATFEQKFNDHYPERLQHSLPATSTVLNIDESPAAATSRSGNTSSTRSSIKRWTVECKKFGRGLFSCLCVCIFVFALISIIWYHQHTKGVSAIRPPPPPFYSGGPTYVNYMPPPPLYSGNPAYVRYMTPPPAFFTPNYRDRVTAPPPPFF